MGTERRVGMGGGGGEKGGNRRGRQRGEGGSHGTSAIYPLSDFP